MTARWKPGALKCMLDGNLDAKLEIITEHIFVQESPISRAGGVPKQLSS